MYPWLLATREYPVSQQHYYQDMRADSLLELCRTNGIIARVSVDSAEAEFPLRRSGGVCYPIGRFTTTLAGPDILALAEKGRILRVHECALYKMGRPFAEGMGALLRARRVAISAGDASMGALSKLVANSLAGRTAMKQGGWERRAALDEPGKWGEEREKSISTGIAYRTRWIFGAAYQWSSEKAVYGPAVAAFAYLTAYGRLHMRSLRALMPDRSVVLQCTDGLHCTAAGFRALKAAGKLSGEGAGSLREVGMTHSAEYVGPRHYRFGETWTLAGYGEARFHPDRGTITHTARQPLWSQRPASCPTDVYRVYRETSLPQCTEYGTVGEDGWIAPLRILRTSSQDV